MLEFKLRLKTGETMITMKHMLCLRDMSNMRVLICACIGLCVAGFGPAKGRLEIAWVDRKRNGSVKCCYLSEFLEDQAWHDDDDCQSKAGPNVISERRHQICRTFTMIPWWSFCRGLAIIIPQRSLTVKPHPNANSMKTIFRYIYIQNEPSYSSTSSSHTAKHSTQISLNAHPKERHTQIISS